MKLINQSSCSSWLYAHTPFFLPEVDWVLGLLLCKWWRPICVSHTVGLKIEDYIHIVWNVERPWRDLFHFEVIFLAGIQYPIICIVYAFKGSKIMEDKSCFCFFLFIHITELWGYSAKTEMSLNFSSNRFPWAKNDYKCPFQSFFSAVTWWRAYIQAQNNLQNAS